MARMDAQLKTKTGGLDDMKEKLKKYKADHDTATNLAVHVQEIANLKNQLIWGLVQEAEDDQRAVSPFFYNMHMFHLVSKCFFARDSCQSFLFHSSFNVMYLFSSYVLV